MKIYFALGEATHLRYLFPLAKQFSLEGGTPVFLPFSKGKYNCIKRHEKILKKLASSINAEINWLPGFKKTGEIIFCVEGAKGEKGMFASGFISQNNTIITLTSQLDFLHNFYVYKDCSQSIIFPSNFIINHNHPKLSVDTFEPPNPKNIAIGCPKYDVVLNKEFICKKYNLSKKPKVLIILPTPSNLAAAGHKLYRNKSIRGLSDDEFLKMYRLLNSLGFEVIIKNRGKFDNLSKHLYADKYMLDTDWFPHTTMELVEISDLVINASSSAIKEVVLSRKPVINFDLFNTDAAIKGFEFLYKYAYCIEYDKFPSDSEFLDAVRYLTSTNLKSFFDDSISKHFFDRGNCSKKILKFIQ
jgi:hypothetical protein